MEIPHSHSDLLGAEFATFATIGDDGRPQLTEVWFLADQDGVAISLNSSRQKTRNLAKRPGCALLILDLANPYRYLAIRGDAQVEPDDDYAFAERVGAKYESDLRQHDRPGEKRVVVRVRPSRVNAVNMGG